MPQFKIMNYVILDNGMSLSSIRLNRSLYRYSEQGMLLYPIGNVIPVIRKGQGCIGVAVIKTLKMDENVTTADFEFTEVDKSTAKVLYSMYRNNISVAAENNDDPYETDAVIPGAMLGGSQKNFASKNNNSSLIDSIYDTLNNGGKSGTHGHRNGSIYDRDE